MGLVTKPLSFFDSRYENRSFYGEEMIIMMWIKRIIMRRRLKCKGEALLSILDGRRK